MIAKYKEQYFCVDLTAKPVEIWRYDVVDGFEKYKDDDLIYYSKFVDITDIDEIFDVAFAVEWSGYWFGADYLSASQRARLFSSDANVIEKFNMNKFERGAWDLYVDIDSCSRFKVTYEDNRTGEYTSKVVSKEEWINLWNKLIVELLPH